MRQWKLVLVLALLLVEVHLVSCQNKKKKKKKKKKKNKKNKNTQTPPDVGASNEFFIIGGSPARANQYPFFTQMYWDNNPAGCGASLVANKWVLTAAHCVHGSFVNQNYLRGYPHWKVGTYCRSGNNNCGAREDYRRTKFIHIHPQYQPNVIRWDYALIELDATVSASVAVPVSLDDGTTFRRLRTGDVVQSIGMGWTNDQREFPEFLQQVSNLFLRECPYTHESILCTNGRNFGTCKGDSGSPGIVRSNTAPSKWVQVGITSFGRVPCENHNSPDGYARVATAYNWVTSVICPTYAGGVTGNPEFCPQQSPPVDPVPPPPPPPPTRRPTLRPTRKPTNAPTKKPTRAPVAAPVPEQEPPTFRPTLRPTRTITGGNPVNTPLTPEPTRSPTLKPTKRKNKNKKRNDDDDDDDDDD